MQMMNEETVAQVDLGTYERVVMDTNVFLDKSLGSILAEFKKPTMVIVPHTVLYELDKFKKGFEQKNLLARDAIRLLDGLEDEIRDGMYRYEEHIIVLDLGELDMSLSNKPDYQIINTAREYDARFYSQDLNARVVARGVGVEADHYEPEEVDVNGLYKGYRVIEINEWEYERLYHVGLDIPEGLEENEFVVYMTPGCKGQLARAEDGKMHAYQRKLRGYASIGSNTHTEHIDEQGMLLEHLFNKDLAFVSAVGPSGCGKTLVTLAAALKQVDQGDYKRLVVMRPLAKVGEDIGYLPGDKTEKLRSWMASTYDAMDILLEDYMPKDAFGMEGFSTDDKVKGLMDEGLLELEAMTYIRGRSLSKQFIIVDDAQNLTRQEAATIITRVGKGSKLVFLGDLSEKQIDNWRLSPSSNGLAYVVDRFRGQDIVGHVTLEKVQRSALANLGVELL